MRRGIWGVVTAGALLWMAAAPAGADAAAVRLAGNDRFLTAIAVSQATYPNDHSAAAVVLSRSDDFADALAGTPLATVKIAPTLLTPTNTLDSRTEAEMKRVAPQGSTVYLLGGDLAISEAVASQVTADGFTVTRLAGSTRYGTAVKVADAVTSTPAKILLARGDDPGDALAAGAAAAHVGGVVILTNGSTMPSESSDYLNAHSSVPVFAIGAKAASADPSATAIVGSDRFDTSVKVAQQFFPNPPALGFANGFAFPDALSGGPAMGQLKGPLILVDYVHLPPVDHDYIVSVHSNVNIAEIYGGPNVISGGTGQTNGGEESAIDGALRGQ